MKIRRRFKSKRLLFQRPPGTTRSEIQRWDLEPHTLKELNHWLLWAGISPEAGMPVSHIGIYTDFT